MGVAASNSIAPQTADPALAAKLSNKSLFPFGFLPAKTVIHIDRRNPISQILKQEHQRGRIGPSRIKPPALSLWPEEAVILDELTDFCVVLIKKEEGEAKEKW